MLINKRKIINDPIYGFISIPSDLVFDVIQHPFFQRLRRIKQLGLADLVYPGASHTRFHHSLGALHLMRRALDVLIAKGHKISEEEEEAAILAILLHDIGHGPFSHSLEHSIIKSVNHEAISLLFFDYFNNLSSGKLEMAKEIFLGTYHKKFLHQLVSSQLDVDRLDYLNRDSFYTGVSEGVIGYDRIIEMLNVVDSNLVVEEKGIYSIEKFIVSRRLMYWQVYLHKTSICAEQMLIKSLERARTLKKNDALAINNTNLEFFMLNDANIEDFKTDKSLLEKFASLDDSDVVFALKKWKQSEDLLLSFLSNALLNRSLFKIEFIDEQALDFKVDEIKSSLVDKIDLKEDILNQLIFYGNAHNEAYKSFDEEILIYLKNGAVKSILEVSEHLNFSKLSKPVSKHYVCYPKQIEKLKAFL